MKRPTHKYTWRKDSSCLSTDRVQLWSDEGNMIGIISLSEAAKTVEDGRALLINEQAIRLVK